MKPFSGVSVEDAVDDVTAALRGRRGLRPGQPNNFDIVTQDAFLKMLVAQMQNQDPLNATSTACNPIVRK